jgi:hypothetical protein
MENNTICGVSLFCRTYDGDAEWLAKSLPTWIDNVKGIDRIIVGGIPGQCKEVRAVCDKYGVEFVPDNESALVHTGYVNQQLTKMRADLFCDSEYVMFVDADTICYREHNIALWFSGDKPILCHSDWSQVGQAKCWLDPMVRALGWKPPYEFMRRLPLIYRTDTIRNCREYMEDFHSVPLWLYMSNLPTFTEFNVIGAYAYEYEREKYAWWCPDGQPPFDNPFKQYWTGADMDAQIAKYKEEKGL